MEDKIRKIVVGQNPKDAMVYFVGMKIGDGVVSDIILEERHLFKNNERKYSVYILKDNTTFKWKSIENMPCVIENDLDF